MLKSNKSRSTQSLGHIEIKESDFFALQATLQTEARIALAQAKEMARIQMEVNIYMFFINNICLLYHFISTRSHYIDLMKCLYVLLASYSVINIMNRKYNLYTKKYIINLPKIAN